MRNSNTAVWFEIYVDDMERASKFYENVFNVKLEELPNPIWRNMELTGPW